MRYKRLQRSFSFRANWMTARFWLRQKKLNIIRRPPYVRARQTIPIRYARRKSFGRSYLKCINDMILFASHIKRILGLNAIQRGWNINSTRTSSSMCFILWLRMFDVFRRVFVFECRRAKRDGCSFQGWSWALVIRNTRFCLHKSTPFWVN